MAHAAGQARIAIRQIRQIGQIGPI